MEDAQNAGFWRAPVTSEHRARPTIVWAGGIFVALGVLCCLAALGAQRSLAPQHVASDSIAAVLLLAPGAALILFKSRVAAGILLGVSTLATALSVVLMLIVASTGQSEPIGFLVLVTLFWAGLAFLTWHALRATIALHGLRGGQARAGLATTVTAGPR